VLASPGRGHGPQAGKHWAGLGAAGAASSHPGMRRAPPLHPALGCGTASPAWRVGAWEHEPVVQAARGGQGDGCEPEELLLDGRSRPAPRPTCGWGSHWLLCSRRVRPPAWRCRAGSRSCHLPAVTQSWELPALLARRICLVPAVNSHDWDIAGDFFGCFSFS